MNRNPFIDYPDLADYIWGTKVGQKWYATLSTNNFSDSKIEIYPNPANDYISILGTNTNGTIEIYSISGAKLYYAIFRAETQLKLNLASGIYLAKITSDNKSVIKKIVIK